MRRYSNITETSIRNSNILVSLATGIEEAGGYSDKILSELLSNPRLLQKASIALTDDLLLPRVKSYTSKTDLTAWPKVVMGCTFGGFPFGDDGKISENGKLLTKNSSQEQITAFKNFVRDLKAKSDAETQNYRIWEAGEKPDMVFFQVRSFFRTRKISLPTLRDIIGFVRQWSGDVSVCWINPEEDQASFVLEKKGSHEGFFLRRDTLHINKGEIFISKAENVG